MAKLGISALLNYNRCDKHCEKPSENQTVNAFTMEEVNETVEYILNYLNKVGREMCK